MCKGWKMFLLLIQGLESKSVEKKADPRGESSSQGPELLRRESKLLWRLRVRPVIHPSVHSFGEQISTEGLLCARHCSRLCKGSSEQKRQNPCPRGMHIHVLFLGKMKSGTISTVHPFSVPGRFLFLEIHTA